MKPISIFRLFLFGFFAACLFPVPLIAQTGFTFPNGCFWEVWRDNTRVQRFEEQATAGNELRNQVRRFPNANNRVLPNCEMRYRLLTQAQGDTVIAETPTPEPIPPPVVVLPPAPPSPPPPSIPPQSNGGVAELPRVFIDSRYVAPQRTVNVPAGANLQAALNAARPGDELVLAANATFTCECVFPEKAGSGWVTVRSAQIPINEGTRVTPGTASGFAKILAPSVVPAVSVTGGRWRLMGLEIGYAPTVNFAYTLAENIGTAEVILDRVYIHGHGTVSFQRCWSAQGGAFAAVDSYFAQCHGKGFDSQAIASWNSPGPFKIVNNYLEGAGENVMFGGSDAASESRIPSDIEIRRNHIFKPTAWRGVWTVKNLLELKNARRVLIEGNVLENNWTDAQAGRAVLFTVRNQDGGNPYATIEDVTYRNNILRGTEHGIHVLGTDYNHPSQTASRILIENNLIEAQYTNLTLGGGIDLQFTRNTLTGAGQVMILTAPQLVRFVYSNNLSNHGEYGVFGDGGLMGTAALNQYAPGYEFNNNLLYGGQRFSASIYPSGTQYNPSQTLPLEPASIGVDRQALNAATAGVAN